MNVNKIYLFDIALTISQMWVKFYFVWFFKNRKPIYIYQQSSIAHHQRLRLPHAPRVKALLYNTSVYIYLMVSEWSLFDDSSSADMR